MWAAEQPSAEPGERRGGAEWSLVNPSSALATVIVDELAAAGVTDVVLSPGSRNAPLSVALLQADRAGLLRLHVRTDERTAGFLAVGLARGSGRPAAVVTTSGTAVANLHPAVLEAHHGQVPLLVLSADRPPHLRDVGANQAIDQRTLFGPALRFFHEFGVPLRQAGQQAGWRSMIDRALAHTRGAAGAPGPVQLNVALTEPLLPTPDEDRTWPESLEGTGTAWTEVRTAVAADRVPDPESGEKVLYLADLTDPRAGELSRAGHLVLSEAGGAAGAQVLATGMHLLACADFLRTHRPDRVVVVGRPTLFRQVTALLSDPAVIVDVAADPTGYADVAGRVRIVAPEVAVTEPDDSPAVVEFQVAWRRADATAGLSLSGELESQKLTSAPRLAADLVAALSDGTTLFLGSSQSPRDVSLAAAARDGLRVMASRGVAGIDGLVSTAVGIALAGTGPTVALLGDLSLLHDAGGLIIGPHEPRPDLTIVVGNNNGGGIFHTLEPGDPEHAEHFERIFGTPHGVDLAGLVTAAGWTHRRVDTSAELVEALAAATGTTVLEIPLDRSDLREQHARLRAAVMDAVAAS